MVLSCGRLRMSDVGRSQILPRRLLMARRCFSSAAVTNVHNGVAAQRYYQGKVFYSITEWRPPLQGSQGTAWAHLAEEVEIS